MKKKILPLLILLTITSQVAFGCSCLKVSHRFMDGISEYPFIALVEVIGKDSSGKDSGYPNYSFTVVRIINQYTGDFKGKEVKIIDAKGFECFTKLGYERVGDTFIIKGSFTDNYNFVEPSLNDDFVELSLCDMNSLKVEGNDVVGWINRSFRWFSFLKKITFGLIERKKHEYKLQRMKLEDFRELLAEKLAKVQR